MRGLFLSLKYTFNLTLQPPPSIIYLPSTQLETPRSLANLPESLDVAPSPGIRRACVLLLIK